MRSLRCSCSAAMFFGDLPISTAARTRDIQTALETFRQHGGVM